MTPAAAPESFPSLLVRSDGLEPRGAFAENQARFLAPDRATSERLDRALTATRTGVVAHYYMDPELQGVLGACRWPHIHVSDSLAMADRAIGMVEGGCRAVVVLGVDFMSENVRAMLDATGHADVPVYRVAADPIGCSLAESAEAPAYRAWLDGARETPNSLHVIYINTSLEVKARSQALVPTITCTSSNVVATILQAAAQVPNVNVWFGPDTYMGENLASMLERYAQLEPEAVAELHPAHTPASIADLRRRFRYFPQGTCIVHHMFGREVAERVRREYPQAYVAAHLEVPGEMFALGLEGQQRDEGVVGSTSNILDFIRRKVDEAAHRAEVGGPGAHPTFVLGTEAGMITPIVRDVQASLREHERRGASGVDARIVFPVADEAVTATGQADLPVVPGVSGGEGCAVEGGCATCPYMKMNSLDALLDVVDCIGSDDHDALAPMAPRSYPERIDGRSMAELARESIGHMRDFQRTGRLSDALVADIRARCGGG